jgi:light-regulated signal transduction histidine kinase (bacteriophytochrome)/CheY-like chemotaxis protein/HPt (histidine-containing phosphotransfer) domain-containing protein
MPDRHPPLVDRDLIQFHGAIQPHGAVLGTRIDDWDITHASANLATILGHKPHAVLGRPLREAIGDGACAALRGIVPSSFAAPEPVQFSITGAQGRALHLRAHRTGPQICIDIEPADLTTRYTSPLLLTQPVLDSFKNATSVAELYELAVRGLRTITGYDRVMICRFDAHGQAETVAEICTAPIEPCLGAGLPESANPAQTRRHYAGQRVGMVPDADYTPVPILACRSPDDGLPLDLSYSQLRGIPAPHRAQMRAMKTPSSLTIALSDGEVPWGMMLCHHATLRRAGIELRAAVNVIGQVVSLLHASLLQADRSTQRLRRNTLLRTLVERLASAPSLRDAMVAVQSEVLHLVDATGAIIRIAGNIQHCGVTPPAAAAAQIMAVLRDESGGEIMAVEDLGCRHPAFAVHCDTSCGALLLPLNYSADDAILWLRPERWQPVDDADGPAGQEAQDPQIGRPAPAGPGTAPRDIIKHRSLPWTQADMALAAEVARRVEAEIVRRTKAALARAQDASRAKSRFLAGMTHELRTPLHGILGYAQLLSAEGNLNALQSMRVQAMMGASTHLLEMINRVLELSEIESEQVRLCAVALDAASVAECCLDVVRPAAEAKNLALRVTVAAGTQTQIVADPMRLRQVLLNLLGNAVKFTQQGVVELRLAAAAQRGAIRLEVADTGPGIPEGQRTRLFQDFERLQNDAIGDVEGAGLGLALSARLAGLMGGCIGYEPGEGGGSVFWLELPHGHAPAPPASQAAVPAETPPATKLHVLVVDDVAINRDIAESFLRAAGHDVTPARGGAEAVAAAAAQDFDVVLMDVRMPGMDGLEATRRIRALGGTRGAVPVIALTAQAFADQVEECRKAGMQDHLPKPFSPDMLMNAVTRPAQARLRAAESGPLAAGPPAGPGQPGAALPVLDDAMFARIAHYLPAESVANYLRTMCETGAELMAELRASGAAGPDDAGRLAELAHRLAGSAGMFGFTHLSDLGRRFERSVQAAADDMPGLARSLAASIETSLAAIPAGHAAARPDATHDSGTATD